MATKAKSAAKEIPAAERDPHGEPLAVQEKKELEAAPEPEHPGRSYLPYTDIYETEEALIVVMEIPGVARDAVDIQLERDVLTVRAGVDFSKYSELRPVYTEYNVGNFSRSFRLSGTFDAEAITAKVADGVLTLELPKQSQARAQRIPVG